VSPDAVFKNTFKKVALINQTNPSSLFVEGLRWILPKATAQDRFTRLCGCGRRGMQPAAVHRQLICWLAGRLLELFRDACRTRFAGSLLEYRLLLNLEVDCRQTRTRLQLLVDTA
jgi:hypothetical protein